MILTYLLTIDQSFVNVIGAAGMAVGSSATTPPRRYVAYTASFSCKHTLQQVYEFLTTHLKISREDMRLWKVKDEVYTC